MGLFARREPGETSGGFLGHPEAAAEGWRRRREAAKKMASTAFLGAPAGAVGSASAGSIKAVETIGWGVRNLLNLDFTDKGLTKNKEGEDAFIKAYKWARG